jgi:fluoride ion exporter CrcB/FEX
MSDIEHYSKTLEIVVNDEERSRSASNDNPNSSTSDSHRQYFVVFEQSILPIFSVGALAICGSAFRLALLLMIEHPFAGNTYFFPNCIGSFIMGFVTFFPTFQTSHKIIFKSITTGFCGSLTTFSSWIFAGMKENITVSASLQEFVSGLCFPFYFFMLGQGCANQLQARGMSNYIGQLFVYKRIRFQNHWMSHDIPLITMMCIFSVITPLFFLSPSKSHNELTHACYLAPFGAVLRMLICDRLNIISTKFRYGTFASNILAVFIYGILYRIEAIPESVIKAISSGALASLSTVSSWVSDAFFIMRNDSTSMSPHDRVLYAVFYCLLSVLLSVVIGVLFIYS